MIATSGHSHHSKVNRHPIEMALSMKAVTVPPETSVEQTVKQMARTQMEIALVQSEGRLKGVFAVSDLIQRVIANGRDLRSTAVGEVMTDQVLTIPHMADLEEAEKVMLASHFHYLPVTDDYGKVIGVISVLDCLRLRLKQLSEENRVLSAYVAVDGIGGD